MKYLLRRHNIYRDPTVLGEPTDTFLSPVPLHASRSQTSGQGGRVRWQGRLTMEQTEAPCGESTSAAKSAHVAKHPRWHSLQIPGGQRNTTAHSSTPPPPPLHTPYTTLQSPESTLHSASAQITPDHCTIGRRHSPTRATLASLLSSAFALPEESAKHPVPVSALPPPRPLPPRPLALITTHLTRPLPALISSLRRFSSHFSPLAIQLCFEAFRFVESISVLVVR
jgi:hypothetical protein